MCGIAGAWEFKGAVDRGALERVSNGMHHRGPDDSGVYIDHEHQVGLAHRRLAIIDLSPGGHQPMQRGDLTITFNGEIYNYQEIRRELAAQGVAFTSTSDTEVLLRAFEKWGEAAITKFRGMFAFAIWDAKKRTLTLCRDRVGVKPLYYFHDGSRFLFASEFGALARHPAVTREVDPEAVSLYLWLGYIPAPLSMFTGIRKLEAGHTLTVKSDGSFTTHKYWDILDGADRGSYPTDDAALVDETERVLTEAFKLRMVADVPVGVFLSGGIDSAIVSALLMKDAKRPLTTFTVGFNEPGFDEAEAARAVAKHLGTDHHEIYLSHEKGAEIVERIPEMFGEPYGGASAIPTFLVSQFAREKVTVALSADGGDELFCGYGAKYPAAAAMYEKYKKLPALAGPAARIALAALPGARDGRYPRLELLAARGDLPATYALMNRRLFAYAEIPSLLKHEARAGGLALWRSRFEGLEDLETAQQLALFDTRTFLADNIMTKVDRASMAVSLESREPFLDPEVMRLAASLPTSAKYKNGESKYLLRQILYRHVPRELVDRPKHGFSMPIRALLSAGAVPHLERYLDPAKIKEGSVLNPEAVAREKQLFLDGKSSPRRAWLLVVLRMWEEQWM